MKKKIRLKNKFKFVLIMVVIGIFFIILNIKNNYKDNNKKETIDLPPQGDINLVKNWCENKNCEFNYEYDSNIKKDDIIKNELIDDKYVFIVSKGDIPISEYINYSVNELGNVPIMMYHGIVNEENNKYTGGNVDKDGYNRTSNAFRKDLDFYYNKGYRMIRLIDYINGDIDVSIGYSPIILTFDDGNKNNFNVLGKDSEGNLIIDPNSAVGILEEYKSKYKDFNVTATFFINKTLFNQPEYNEEIVKWLVDNGYDIGNHTTNHADFKKISIDKTKQIVGEMYQELDRIIKDKYVKIVALPFGSPYKMSHENFPYILKGEYNGYSYETIGALRVGWDSELSPFKKDFNKEFLKRCRAYDNNGVEFDIEMVFKNLEKNKYISDGNKDTITFKKENNILLGETYNKKVIKY